MDAQTISDILQCRITAWDHPNITRLNPSVRCAVSFSQALQGPVRQRTQGTASRCSTALHLHSGAAQRTGAARDTSPAVTT